MLRLPGMTSAPPRPGEHRSIPMQLIRRVVNAAIREEAGQGLAEYALILALVAIIAIVALMFLGNQISSIITQISESL
jgi:Flp pilus assembly pilin Flp